MLPRPQPVLTPAQGTSYTKAVVLKTKALPYRLFPLGLVTFQAYSFSNEMKNLRKPLEGNFITTPAKTFFQAKPWANIPLDGLTAQWRKLVETGHMLALSGWVPSPAIQSARKRRKAKPIGFLTSNFNSLCCIQGNEKQLMQTRSLSKAPNYTYWSATSLPLPQTPKLMLPQEI